MRNLKTFSLVLVSVLVLVFVVVSVAEVSAHVQTEDEKFSDWFVGIIEEHIFCSDRVNAALGYNDTDAAGFWFEKEYDICEDALAEIDGFDVSQEIKPILNEKKLGLQDLKTAAYYGESWAKSLDNDDFDKYILYLTRATEHINKCADLYDKLTEEIEKDNEKLELEIALLKSTPKPTPLAMPKPTPLATPKPTPELTSKPEVELDSDGDGVPDKYDYAPNDPAVQIKEDIKTPGFGVILAIGSLMAVVCFIRKRR